MSDRMPFDRPYRAFLKERFIIAASLMINSIKLSKSLQPQLSRYSINAEILIYFSD